ncbi:Disease resistance protein L6 [Linum perenne]
MGGIGKTTIAKAVYNNISSRFNRCCFVENVRETQGHEDGVVALQKKLVSEILRMGSIGFTHDSGGRKMIKERVSRFKSLIVFDDVDEKFKFHDVLGSLKDFTSESRFIITSRNERVLSTLGENECRLYEVGSMSQSRSLELFSKHAFKMNSPPPDYKTLANDIVLTTGGLPLTLKVIGSLLYREEIAVWKDKLEQLHETLELEVLDRLKISYDSLAYEAQQIFLDIACFFIGENKEMSSYMWTDCRFYPASNIKILIQRSMIKVGNKDEFQMHDQLRDMGAEIVRREDIERPWMRSRIWSTKDGIELLSNIKGSSQVKAISLDSVFSVKSDLESVYFYNLPELRYFYATNILFFTKITKTMFTGDFSNLLPNLRWLQLHQYSHSEEDDHHLTNFILKNLVILILEDCRITNDWGGWSHIKMAERLKVVKLSKCYGFTRLPELPRNIEVLSIRGIKYKVNIQELDILFKKKKKELDIEYIQELDIEELNKLKALVLSKICIGKISGGTFGMLKELEELDLNYLECSNLREAVADVGQLTSLKILRTAGAKEVEYDCPLGLKELYTSSWISSLAELLELEVLRVYGCEDGLDIPLATSEDQDSVWWKVSKLKYLFLTGTKINNNVSDHGGGGRFLLPTSLISLRIRKCHEPTSLIFPSMENLKNLTRLEVDDVLFQTHLDGLEGLRSLETLFINNVSGLTKIKGLRDLLCSSTCKLESLQISSCLDLNELVTCELDQTVLVPSLQCLSIGPCPHLDVGPVIRGLSKFPTLKKLALIKVMITKEEDLEVIGTLEELDTLELELYPSSLERIPSLSKLKKLESLTLSLPSLRDIEGLGELKSLKELCLQNCESLERLWLEDHHPQLCSLGTLNIRNCKSLSVDHLSALKTSLPPGVAITWPDHFRNQRRGRGRRGRRQL